MPKLLAVCGRAKMYEAPYGDVALFWGIKPVAIFPNLTAAVRYIYHEFYTESYLNDEEPQGEDDWVI